jgi:hypothetical protein
MADRILPQFDAGAFLLASLDYLIAHPLAFGALLAAALLIVVELCLAVARLAAARRVQRDALRRQQLGALVSITDRRRHTGGHEAA